MIEFALLLPPDADQADADSLRAWLRADPDLRGRLHADESYPPSAGAMGDAASIVVTLDSVASSPALARALLGWMRARPDPPVLTVSTGNGWEARLDPGSAVAGIASRLSTALAEAAGPPIMTRPDPSWPDPAGLPQQQPRVPRQPGPRDPRPVPPPRSGSEEVGRSGPQQGSPRGPQQTSPPRVHLPDRAGSTAILIGVSDYTDPALSGLSTVQRGLRALADALTDPARSGFAADRCLILHNPGLHEVSRAIAEAGHTATDTVLVYFAGHLIVDEGETFLAMHDTDPARLRWSALPIDDLRRELERSTARHRLLVLDGALSAAAGSDSTRQALAHIEIDRGEVLVIASGSRPASEAATGVGTAFSGALLDSGLRPFPAGPSLLGLQEVYRGLQPRLSGPDDLLYLKSHDRDRVGLLRNGKPPDHWVLPGPGYPTSAVNTALPARMPRFVSFAEARRRLASAWRSAVVAVRDVLDLSLPDRKSAHAAADRAVDASWARLEDQFDQLTREIGPPFDADDDRSRGPHDRP
ncbi:effector-associated constant component EACC1 [Actinoplanes subglobosus]|uniref:Uncharacterized protein n=1 Tax=Actinoplanes subglobosus TaxID=1547892 RepID=A0ABV8IK11_9ACTN